MWRCTCRIWRKLPHSHYTTNPHTLHLSVIGVTLTPEKEAIQKLRTYLHGNMEVWEKRPYGDLIVVSYIHNLSLHTWRDWLILAPFLSSRSTTSQCPSWLAMNRGDASVYSVGMYMTTWVNITWIKSQCKVVTKSLSFTKKYPVYFP